MFLDIEHTLYFTRALDGLPKTSKDDKNYHGYGTKSIVYVIKNYMEKYPLPLMSLLLQ